METKQTEFWKGEFGAEYTERNSPESMEAWDERYIEKFGITRTEMLREMLDGIDKDIKILEIGCNTAYQLRALQALGFKNLYGVELQWYAVEKSKKDTQGINIIQGSGFDLPFRDGYFDLVMTNGVLIHIKPDDLPVIMGEAYRCSKKYIAGFEYYSDDLKEIKYRGNQGFLWKADYKGLYQKQFKDLQFVKEKNYPYVKNTEQGNQDVQFLLKKS